jgi:hypothetical protein
LALQKRAYKQYEGCPSACLSTCPHVTRILWVYFRGNLILATFINSCWPTPIFVNTIRSNGNVTWRSTRTLYSHWTARVVTLFPAGATGFSLFQNVQTDPAPHPASNSEVTGASSPALNWQGCETGYLPRFNFKVKNGRSYISSPPICFYGMCRDNFNIRTVH